MRMAMLFRSSRFTKQASQLLMPSAQNNSTYHGRIGANFRAVSVSTQCPAKVRHFTDKHEWIIIDGNVGIVGISHYAQDSLGDVVYAQLPDVGTEVKRKDECGALESVKAASELYSPVSGRVVEKNVSVEETPALINRSCYEKGWLFKVELLKPEELEDLMTEADYEKFLKTDTH